MEIPLPDPHTAWSTSLILFMETWATQIIAGSLVYLAMEKLR